jgi:flagellar biosynthesis protein FlhG
MTVFIPVASGKGGTGKTVFSSNLGVTLAGLGKTVILIDLDLGGSNLHTVLGIKNTLPGIGNLIYKKEHNLESILVQTEYGRLHFIPGDALLPGTANMEYSAKKKLIKGIKNLVADYVIMDLGSGTSFNTVDFFLLSPDGFIVTTPEITSVLNAYSFIKTALYRLLYLSFPAKSEERKIITDFITQQIEGAKTSFNSLIYLLSRVSPESGAITREQMRSFMPRVVINMAKTQNDVAVGTKLNDIVNQNLGIKTEYASYIGYQAEASKAIAQRKPLVLLYPDTQYARTMTNVSHKIIARTLNPNFHISEPDGEFEGLGEKLGTL